MTDKTKTREEKLAGRTIRRGQEREVRTSLREARLAKPGTKAHEESYAEALRWAAISEAHDGAFAVQPASYSGTHLKARECVIEYGSWMPRAKRRLSRTHYRNGRVGRWS